MLIAIIVVVAAHNPEAFLRPRSNNYHHQMHISSSNSSCLVRYMEDAPAHIMCTQSTTTTTTLPSPAPHAMIHAPSDARRPSKFSFILVVGCRPFVRLRQSLRPMWPFGEGNCVNHSAQRSAIDGVCIAPLMFISSTRSYKMWKLWRAEKSPWEPNSRQLDILHEYYKKRYEALCFQACFKSWAISWRLSFQWLNCWDLI